MIFREIDKAELICDPFCGSGASGLSAVFKGASAFLSDINPVSIFIAYNSLNDKILEDETIKAVKELCWEIEKEVYTLDGSKVVNFAVWRTNYKCPSCGQKVNSITSSKVYCKKCGKMLSINDLIVDEKIVSLKFLTGGNSKDAKLIKSYSEIEDSLKIDWYPKGEFVYPATTIKFK
ncbi:MAG: DNA adenine methylase, partial [Nitrososphaerota archaeon]